MEAAADDDPLTRQARAAEYLDAVSRQCFDRLASADDPASLLRREDAELACLNTLVQGQR